MTPWDVDLIAVYCDAAATYHQCRAIIGDDYAQTGSVKGTTVKSPLWRVMQDCIETMAKIGGRFGLTPTDRAGLDVSEVEQRPMYGPRTTAVVIRRSAGLAGPAGFDNVGFRQVEAR